MESTIEPGKLYTPAEINSRLQNVTARRIVKEVRDKRLKGKFLGRRCLVLGSHLLNWLESDSAEPMTAK
ncbi:MAG: hypothetical protein LW850_29035 [Planctomycetaceae bacterium]|jgi:hypothetical protein|nr:hypothetical protein [Planctomycetaceae bacterium]